MWDAAFTWDSGQHWDSADHLPPIARPAGMSRRTGRGIAAADHLRQSIGDVLTTPIGTRVMRRDYGSAIPGMLDAPLTEALRMRIYAAAVAALTRWEPRVRVVRIALHAAPDTPGRAVLDLELQIITGADTGRALTLSGVAIT